MTQKIALVLACLACAGQGRRLQSSKETTRATDTFKSTESLAKLLLEFNPLNSAAAFSSSLSGANLQARRPSSSRVHGTAGPLNKMAPRTALIRMDSAVDNFAISRVIKEVKVFEGDYAADIREAVIEVGQEAIRTKNSFSLAIPGGSVVAALGGLEKDALDFSKTHIFFVNEKIPSFPCLEGALEQTRKLGMPDENVHGVGEGEPADIAESYTELLKSHPSIDNSGALPAFDMTLLGTGPDGHCGCVFPDSDVVRATGSGQVMLADNDDRADGDFVAATIDVMCASKVVIISAAGAGRAEMVAKALSGEFGKFDCPAALVEADEATFWFTDTDSIKDYEEVAEDEEEYEKEEEEQEEEE